MRRRTQRLVEHDGRNGHTKAFSLGLAWPLDRQRVGSAEPSQFSLRVGLASVEGGLVLERLLERVSVCRDRESTSLRLTTYLDVGRVPPNPLMDLESIDDLWRFVESDARATIMKGT